VSHRQILKFFKSDHLPQHLKVIAAEVEDLAMYMDEVLPECAETSAGMRKLLEAKDCFVRAAL
jgi:hypothetical protein